MHAHCRLFPVPLVNLKRMPNLKLRSQAVQDLFTHSFSEYFQLKQVPLKHQNPDFRHPLIRIHILKLKKSARVRQKMCELPSGGMEQSA